MVEGVSQRHDQEAYGTGPFGRFTLGSVAAMRARKDWAIIQPRKRPTTAEQEAYWSEIRRQRRLLEDARRRQWGR